MLDEAREKERSAYKDASTKTSQKKLQFLERNLEQLTKVQKQLVQDNSQLTKDLKIAERKINNRNDRIDDLERILQDLSAKMGVEQEK